MTREEAIKLLVNATYSEEWQGNEQLTTAYHIAIEVLEQEPKRGKNISEKDFLCSVCTFGDFGGFHGYKPNYCPNCGARMERDEE